MLHGLDVAGQLTETGFAFQRTETVRVPARERSFRRFGDISRGRCALRPDFIAESEANEAFAQHPAALPLEPETAAHRAPPW